MAYITDQKVEAELGSFGIPFENFFLFPVESESRGLIGFWHQAIGFRYLILEDPELAKACYKYLETRGARRFNTNEELSQAIATEKWPGWDTCADAVRDFDVQGSQNTTKNSKTIV